MRTNPLCYLAALLLALGGMMASTPILAAPWQDLESAGITHLDAGKKIDVTDRGVAFFTDIVQERDVTCRSNPEKALEIRPKFDLVNNDGDRTWHLLSTSVDAKAGSYAVACTPRDRALDSANYGYAELPSWAAAKRNGGGIIILALSGAVIIAAWCWWGRRTERKLASYESA